MAIQPTLALIPAAQGSKLYSVLPSNGVGDFDFTRASTATRINSKGLIEEVASGVSRLDYTGGGCPHHLLEPQRTNLVPYSQTFTGWNLVNVVETPNALISPDGRLNASKFVTSNNGVDIKYTNVPVNQGTTYTYSFYCNYVGGEGLEGRFYDNTNGANIEFYDYTSQLEVGEWKRVTRTFTTPAGCTNIQVWYLAQSSTNPVTAYYWGAQLESGTYATSYVPTNGEIGGVTRLAETADNAGNAATFNDSEGVLFVEMNAFDNTSRISLSSGSAINRVSFKITDGNIDFQYRVGGIYSYRVDVNVDNSNTNKIAMSFNNGVFVGYLNGVAIGSPISGASLGQGVLDRLNFNDGGSSDNFYGNVKDLRVYNTALTSLEIETITSFTSFNAMALAQNYTI